MKRAPITSIRVSQTWISVFCFLQVILVAPYVSNALPWAYENGLFPLRPAFYLILVGTLNFLWVMPKGPDWTMTSFLVLALVSFRLLDAALLERFTYPDGHSSAVFGLGATVFVTFIMFSCVGVMHKTSFLPALFVAAISIVICVFSIAIEWMGLIQATIVEGRFSGYSGDPNRACVAMNTMLAAFLTLSKRFWLNVAMIGITAIGVFPTLSRGGLLILTLITAVYVFKNARQHFTKIALVAALAVPAGIASVSIIASKNSSNGRIDSNVEERISALFGGEVSGLQSNDRMKDLTDGLEALGKAPLFGLGTGAGTNLLQPHNQVISLWIDMGLFGALLYVLILVLLLWKCLSSQFKSIYLVIPLVLYFPLSQTLVENHAYVYAAAIAIVTSSTVFISIQSQTLSKGNLSRWRTRPENG